MHTWPSLLITCDYWSQTTNQFSAARYERRARALICLHDTDYEWEAVAFHLYEIERNLMTERLACISPKNLLIFSHLERLKGPSRDDRLGIGKKGVACFFETSLLSLRS